MHFNFGGFNPSQLYGILDAVEKCFVALLDLDFHNQPCGEGGFFVLRDGTTNDILIVIQVGDVPQKERMKRYHLSLEKGDRVFRTQGRMEQHVSSSESRDPKRNKLGGAIITCESDHRYILSFDGLGEEHDEALMTAVAVKLQWMSKGWANEIANAYGNAVSRSLQSVIA